MIYVLEDDDNIRELVIYTLNSSGLEAEGFARPSEFKAAIEISLPNLVLLDIMLPEEDGLSVLRYLKADKRTQAVPVILLTAKDSEYDKVMGLNLGADDYIAKPFGMMELVARVNARLRTMGTAAEASGIYNIGCMQINRNKHTVYVDKQEVSLTLKEFETLVMLAENRDMVVTREKLLSSKWGYNGTDVESRTVDVHIRRLRQKLGVAGKYIETVRGVGYKIRGELTE